MNDTSQTSRISRHKLEQYAVDLPVRDIALLCDLDDCRYLTTDQIARLRFAEDHTNPGAALRATNRTLTRLKEQGLIVALNRRIGGVRGGSGGLIWSLAPAGYRLVCLNSGETDEPRRRRFEPSPQFTKHTLAIAESYIQLLHISGISLDSVVTRFRAKAPSSGYGQQQGRTRNFSRIVLRCRATFLASKRHFRRGGASGKFHGQSRAALCDFSSEE